MGSDAAAFWSNLFQLGSQSSQPLHTPDDGFGRGSGFRGNSLFPSQRDRRRVFVNMSLSSVNGYDDVGAIHSRVRVLV